VFEDRTIDIDIQIPLSQGITSEVDIFEFEDTFGRHARHVYQIVSGVRSPDDPPG